MEGTSVGTSSNDTDESFLEGMSQEYKSMGEWSPLDTLNETGTLTSSEMERNVYDNNSVDRTMDHVSSSMGRLSLTSSQPVNRERAMDNSGDSSMNESSTSPEGMSLKTWSLSSASISTLTFPVPRIFRKFRKGEQQNTLDDDSTVASGVTVDPILRLPKSEFDILCSRVQQNDDALIEIDLESKIGAKKGAIVLARALKSNETLQKINLGFNNIGVKGATVLAKSLESNTTLHTLNLLGNKIGDREAKALAKALESNTSLQMLHLGSNQIRGEGAKALAKALQSNTTLQHLELHINEIGVVGAKALAKTLESNTTLQRLNLYRNAIHDEGAMALAKALESNTTLHVLSLNSNSISNKGAKALANALESNTTLHELELENNCIGDEGAKAMAIALEINTTLQKLNLSSSINVPIIIGNEGATALVEALKNHNGTLSSLHIDENPISFSIENELRELLKMNKAGTRFPPPTPRTRPVRPAQQSGLSTINEVMETNSQDVLISDVNEEEMDLDAASSGKSETMDIPEKVRQPLISVTNTKINVEPNDADCPEGADTREVTPEETFNEDTPHDDTAGTTRDFLEHPMTFDDFSCFSDFSNSYDSNQDMHACSANEEGDVEPNHNQTMASANDETYQELYRVANECVASEERPPSFSPSKRDRIYVNESDITNDDVKCGIKFAKSDHPGNFAYLVFVDGHIEQHKELGSNEEKKKVKEALVDQLANEGVRFVRKEEEGERFYLLTLQEVREKVGQRLKGRKSRAKPPPVANINIPMQEG